MTNPPTRSPAWKWWVCGLLLSATMINYMDRQTLASLSVRVTRVFGLNEEQYGNLEFAFGLAFAGGSLLFGFLADRLGVRLLYPAVLVGWSTAGILTGFATSYEELLLCRIVLGAFEAGHWPCAITTIQRVLSREQRSFGNSLLQSGAAIGAILTPPAVLVILHWADPGESMRTAQQAAVGGLIAVSTGPAMRVWQEPFVAVGAVGLVWVIGWFLLVRRSDLEGKAGVETEAAVGSVRDAFRDRRFYALLIIVIALNIGWQVLRAWLPKFLIQGRLYSEPDALWFNSLFFVFADIGCLAGGATAAWLVRRGVDVHRSRVAVYAIASLLSALTLLAATLPAGWLLLITLLMVGAGQLALFPCYYSFVQELSRSHLGRVSGILAAGGWLISAPFQKLFGKLVDSTGSFDLGIALAGLPPLLGLVALLLLWRRTRSD